MERADEVRIKAEGEQDLKKSFRWWRLLLPMVLGVVAVGALLWGELKHAGFAAVDAGTGDHAWVDTDRDGTVDLDDAKEFVRAEHGDYRAVSGWERLRQVHLVRFGLLFLLCAAIANGLRDFGYMLRLRTLTHGEIGWRRAFEITAIWEFATAVAPAVVGGTSVAIYVIARDGMPLGRSAAIVLVTAMLDELFFLVFAPAVFFLV
ncbi:MAG TPA: lysylphosphatidylglycerol synthase domain-containing protein, partial [Flavobacteriales bacterium]|nr:lysylphosphatidylglycerol synthase domain-containing protein [Flavobacteriales bacterium]